ncbi:DUF58 domain-containing protein [Halobacteria archaeon HArc-gm2]|nr:DUF58 domain-containing protein [Halobacteria archaeon HArc-gm2]
MIDAAFLDELDRFDGSLSQVTDARQRGEQRSTELGEGQRFADYRSYVPGDDTRLVDWKLYARTGERYVKQFEAERDLTVHVLLDASASMDVGGEEMHKFEFAAKLGLGFCALAAAEHNDFRFSVFTDRFDRIDAGRSNRGEVLALIDRLNEIELAGEADFDHALVEYAATIDSRSLVLVASDFLADVDDVEAGVEALARNDVVLAQVFAPEEVDPPTSGDTIFRGLERELELRTYFGSPQRRTYSERLESHVERVSETARNVDARHVRVESDAEFFDAFARTWVE